MLCRKFGETEQEIVMLEQRLLQRKKEKKVCLLLVREIQPCFQYVLLLMFNNCQIRAGGLNQGLLRTYVIALPPSGACQENW